MNRTLLLLASALLLSACNNGDKDSAASSAAKSATPAPAPAASSPKSMQPSPKDFNGYYKSIPNTTDAKKLRAALHKRIDGHRVIPYTKYGNDLKDCWQSGKWHECEVDVWEALNYTDAGCGGTTKYCDSVVLLYSNDVRPMSKANRGKGKDDSWDREHVWPKSRGFPKKAQDGYTDLHHLRPADRNINGKHSNLGYDEGGKPLVDETLDGKPVTGINVDLKNQSFEPTDLSKGQVARMLFYMAVRYEPGDDKGDEKMPDLKLIDDNKKIKEPVIGDLCTLMKWHAKFPVTDFERRRNDRVQQIQGNRNPFIDRPQYAQVLWGKQCR